MEMVTINFKTDKKNKILLEQLCERIGISITSLLNMFINATIEENGVPFRVGFRTNNDIMTNKINNLRTLGTHFGEFTDLSKSSNILNELDVVKLIHQFRKDRGQ
jgi:addiction module RelB/DinJ family antitoxin